MRHFLRYLTAQALFMLAMGSWIALLLAFMWGVQRVSPHWLVTLIGSAAIIVVGTTSLLYWFFETASGKRASGWLIGLATYSREGPR
jgi:hypothetical protein